VADARLALQVMAQGSPQSLALDPQWVPAPLEWADASKPTRVAVFRSWAHSVVDPSVSAAVDQAARWLQAAGYTV
jgi:amidase